MATYKRDFIKLTFGGRIGDLNDEWVCGINLRMVKDRLIAPWTDYSRIFKKYGEQNEELFKTLFSNYVSNKDMNVPSGATLDEVKIAHIGQDGNYQQDPIVWEIDGVTGYATNPYAPQIACVMTMSSDKRKDPGKNNRFYLPYTSTGGSGFRVQNTKAKADATANLLKALTQPVQLLEAGFVVEPAAVSTSSKTGDGEFLPITQVKVGNVQDTQRRRRNKLVESYAVTKLED